eukprot:UN03890
MSSDKPISSSYYHGRLTTKGEEAERYKPKKADGPIEEQQPSDPAKSKWNAAGTFETTDFSKPEIQQALNQTFSTFGEQLSTAGSFVITVNAINFDGYASTMFTRNKKGLGFEITIKLDWSAASPDGQELTSGVIQLGEVDFASLDDFDVKYTTSNKNDNYLAVVKTLRSKEKLMRKAVATWVDTMLKLDA